MPKTEKPQTWRRAFAIAGGEMLDALANATVEAGDAVVNAGAEICTGNPHRRKQKELKTLTDAMLKNLNR